jgi:hypothetical protein
VSIPATYGSSYLRRHLPSMRATRAGQDPDNFPTEQGASPTPLGPRNEGRGRTPATSWPSIVSGPRAMIAQRGPGPNPRQPRVGLGLPRRGGVPRATRAACQPPATSVGGAEQLVVLVVRATRAGAEPRQRPVRWGCRGIVSPAGNSYPRTSDSRPDRGCSSGRPRKPQPSSHPPQRRPCSP